MGQEEEMGDGEGGVGVVDEDKQIIVSAVS